MLDADEKVTLGNFRMGVKENKCFVFAADTEERILPKVSEKPVAPKSTKTTTATKTTRTTRTIRKKGTEE